MDKKLKELKEIYENDTSLFFTNRNKQKVLENIKNVEERSNGKVNHFFPTIVTATMITALLFVSLFIINHQLDFIDLGYSNGHGDEQIRSSVLLENVISKDGDEYKFEQIPWFSTKQELIDSGHIPSDLDDTMTIQADGESIMLDDHIMFKDPQSEAKVIYKFQHDLFIGGEYIIIAKDDDDLLRIGTDLKNKVSDFPEPIEGTLDGLSEEAIRSVRHGSPSGARWWNGDNNIEDSSFEISITKTADGEGIIKLSVRPPKLPEKLEKELIEKGYLPPDKEEPTKDEETIGEITYETTIELSDELLEVYSQYESSLDDLMLKELSPIEIFKIYYHAKKMDNKEVIYALYLQDEMYGLPDKETYFNDISFNETYYEELTKVKIFKEVYLEVDQAGVIFTTDSVEYDFFFRLIRDDQTDVWKVSWLPIQ